MKKIEGVKWCPQHGYPLPCDKCGMPKPSGRLLTDEITKILEVWQDTDKDYVVCHSFNGVAQEVSRLLEARIEALTKHYNDLIQILENDQRADIEALIEALSSCRNALAIIVDTDKPVDTRNIIARADKALKATHLKGEKDGQRD